MVGSSPLARGLLLPVASIALKRRIIPARAGFTIGPPSEARRGRDHPRSRGVYVRAANGQQEITGSSPLARGLLRQHAGRRRHQGIIPARAGFTRVTELIGWSPPDHPRSRGVYITGQSRVPARTGSSPLARGLPGSVRAQPGPLRIIPARAGFTCSLASTSSPSSDHPRSRGVYRDAFRGGVRGGGSSPLARGLLPH